MSVKETFCKGQAVSWQLRSLTQVQAVALAAGPAWFEEFDAVVRISIQLFLGPSPAAALRP